MSVAPDNMGPADNPRGSEGIVCARRRYVSEPGFQHQRTAWGSEAAVTNGKYIPFMGNRRLRVFSTPVELVEVCEVPILAGHRPAV